MPGTILAFSFPRWEIQGGNVGEDTEVKRVREPPSLFASWAIAMAVSKTLNRPPVPSSGQLVSRFRFPELWELVVEACWVVCPDSKSCVATPWAGPNMAWATLSNAFFSDNDTDDDSDFGDDQAVAGRLKRTSCRCLLFADHSLMIEHHPVP